MAAQRTNGRLSRVRRSHRAAAILHDAYGSPHHGNKEDPLDELVFILLSQMTTHHSFNRVFERVKAFATTWDEVLRMRARTFKALIKDAGLSGQKGPRIRAILSRLQADFGSVTLEPLKAMGDGAAEDYLLGLPGVGIKTAKCVLMYSLGRQVLPVDTHVWRLARRLGLVEEGVPYSRVHGTLEMVVAPEDRYTFHVNAIAHGRALCLPLRPRCGLCPLRRLCPSRDLGSARGGGAKGRRRPRARARAPRGRDPHMLPAQLH